MGVSPIAGLGLRGVRPLLVRLGEPHHLGLGVVPVADVEHAEVELALVAVVRWHPRPVHVDEVLGIELDYSLGGDVRSSAEEGVFLRHARVYGLVDELVVDLGGLIGGKEARDVEEYVRPDHALRAVGYYPERAVVVYQPDLRSISVLVLDLNGVRPPPVRVPEWPR